MPLWYSLKTKKVDIRCVNTKNVHQTCYYHRTCMKLWLLHFAFNIRYFGALSEVVMTFIDPTRKIMLHQRDKEEIIVQFTINNGQSTIGAQLRP